MPETPELRVLHIITGLNPGGAELMLYRLVGSLESKGVSNSVCSLTGVGQVGNRLREEGIQVHSAELGDHPLKAISSLRDIISRIDPDVVHTWLYHADLLGGIAARKFPGVAVVWSLRNCRLKTKWSTGVVARLCALFSNRLPTLIAACADSARSEHVARGYPEERIEVIPNGFDTQKFHPNPERGWAIRAEMGIDENLVVFGLVGRSDPNKDHEGFIEAASKHIESHPDSNVLFLFCGRYMDKHNDLIVRLIKDSGLNDRVLLAGARSDIEDMYQAFDVLVSSSLSEGFPNVVGEAMACGKPCIVTDVGDSKKLLNGAGIVVPPRDPDAMAGAIARMAFKTPTERAGLGAIGRQTIENDYGLSGIADRYLGLYRRGVALCAA